MIVKSFVLGFRSKFSDFWKDLSVHSKLDLLTWLFGLPLHFSQPTNLLKCQGQYYRQETAKHIHTFESLGWTSYLSKSSEKMIPPLLVRSKNISCASEAA